MLISGRLGVRKRLKNFDGVFAAHRKILDGLQHRGVATESVLDHPDHCLLGASIRSAGSSLGGPTLSRPPVWPRPGEPICKSLRHRLFACSRMTCSPHIRTSDIKEPKLAREMRSTGSSMPSSIGPEDDRRIPRAIVGKPE